MPVTLAQAKLNATDDIQLGVIDEFRKSSWLLDNLTFDDVVNPAGGGATLTYGYQRLITQATAAFRAINAEYTPQEVTKQRYSVDLKPLGGSFQIDRVLANIGAAAANEVTLQMTQKIKAANAAFNNAVINGDSAVDANAFDGLNKALAGTATEMGTGTFLDWTGITSEGAAHTALDTVDTFLALLDEEPTALIANAKLLAKVRSIARRAGYYTRDANEFGRGVERYGNIVLIDPGKRPGTNDDVLAVETRDPDGAGTAFAATTGLTDLYAVRLGLDGFHAVSMAGQPLVQTWLPDFTRAGAVKTGEVELGPTAVALKATKAAAVYRNIKVQ